MIVEGSTGTISVALTHDPSVDFVVSIGSGDSSIISVSPSSLTFNSTNYSTAQNVTLTALVDANQTSESVTITASASGVTSQTRSVQAFDVNPPTFVSVTTGLLKTGQEISVLSGDDGTYWKGISKAFSTGSASGLLFQRCSRGQTPPSCTGTPILSNLADAKSYCDTLNLGGKTWRLPTIKELSYLWDYSVSSFNNAYFPNTVPYPVNGGNTLIPLFTAPLIRSCFRPKRFASVACTAWHALICRSGHPTLSWAMCPS